MTWEESWTCQASFFLPEANYRRFGPGIFDDSAIRLIFMCFIPPRKSGFFYERSRLRELQAIEESGSK